MLKKIMCLLIILVSIDTIACPEPASGTCEFRSGTNFGVCFQNKTQRVLSEKFTVVVQADAAATLTDYSIIPQSWFIVSTHSIDAMKQSGIHWLRYLLIYNDSEVAKCSRQFIVEESVAMQTPLVLNLLLDENNKFYCE